MVLGSLEWSPAGDAGIAGYQAFPGRGAYCGSKAAMRMELEALRAELRPEGIAVTTVNPGFIRTPLTDRHDFDMPFLMELDDAGRALKKGLEAEHYEVDVAATGEEGFFQVSDFHQRSGRLSKL